MPNVVFRAKNDMKHHIWLDTPALKSAGESFTFLSPARYLRNDDAYSPAVRPAQ